MGDYIVTLIQNRPIRSETVAAGSSAEAARTVNETRHDPLGAVYRVQGPDASDAQTVQVLPGRVRAMSDRAGW